MAGVPFFKSSPPVTAKLATSMPSREVQELWFATRRRDWSSLCIVPASPGMSALGIAQSLADVGGLIRRGRVRVIQAEGMDLGQIAQLVMEMTTPGPPTSVWTSAGARPGPSATPDGSPLIIALESVVANPLVLPVALASDIVLLAVELGATHLEAARHSIELLGRDRILGTVLVRPG